MTARTAKADNIHNLSDWVKRWPKYDNLEFDSVSREPSIYTPVKRGDPGRTKLTNEALRWKRNGDVMTVLSDPKKFSPEMVDSATEKYRKYCSDIEGIKTSNIDVLRQREAALLAAWDVYTSSPSPSSIQDILKAQKDFTEIERVLTEQTREERSTLVLGKNSEYKKMFPQESVPDYIGTYSPALPWGKRVM